MILIKASALAGNTCRRPFTEPPATFNSITAGTPAGKLQIAKGCVFGPAFPQTNPEKSRKDRIDKNVSILNREKDACFDLLCCPWFYNYCFIVKLGEQLFFMLNRDSELPGGGIRKPLPYNERLLNLAHAYCIAEHIRDARCP